MTRKNFLVFSMIMFILLTFPSVAFANAPPPLPNDHDILIDNYVNIDNISIYAFDKDGNKDVIETYTNLEMQSKTKISSERIIDIFHVNPKYTHIQITVDLNDGNKVVSNKVQLSEWQNYAYSVNENKLIPSGPYASRKPHGWTVFFGIFVLIVPLGLTILMEWVTACIFKIKPSKYVCFINLITNPLMNIILLYGFANFVISYLLLVLILEFLVLVVEYVFYVYKYKDTGRLKLFVFTVTANAVSWGTYALFNYYF